MGKRIVQWGAGNIGRAFIGQIFARAGYEVIFIDINTSLVEALQEAGSYRVVSVANDGEEEILVGGIQALDGRDEAAVLDAIAGADYLSTSVGQGVLPLIAPLMAKAIEHRWKHHPGKPLDIIIAENISSGAEVLRSLLAPYLPDALAMDSCPGFVESSLGKMVPIQSGRDPLKVYAEPFNTLILDRAGFKGEVPRSPHIRLVEPIGAYVAEKLHIHNLGHAAAAYLGYQFNPELEYIWQVMEVPELRLQVRKAMEESGAALRAEYPGVFSPREVDDHIDDLLRRFGNRALGDTIHRVGRDLARKLHRTDRLMGAILMAEKHALPWVHIGKAWLAGLEFRGRDEEGMLYPGDELFLQELEGKSGPGRSAFAAGFSPGASAQSKEDTVSEVVLEKIRHLPEAFPKSGTGLS